MTVQDWLGKDNELGIDIWCRKYQYGDETFEELKARSYLNPAVKNWDHQPETYSQLIHNWEKENKNDF